MHRLRASDNATLRIWNPKNGENIHVVAGHRYHTDGLTCLAISPDSTVVLAGSKGHNVHMVNMSTGKVLSTLTAHKGSVECVGFSPSGLWAATGSMDQKLIVWDHQHSEPRNTFLHEAGLTCLVWLGTSRYIATGCADAKVRVWDTLSGEETAVKIFNGHSDVIQSLSVSADSNFLVSVALDKEARQFDDYSSDVMAGYRPVKPLQGVKSEA